MFRQRTRPVYTQFVDKIGKQFMDESMAFIEKNRKK